MLFTLLLIFTFVISFTRFKFINQIFADLSTYIWKKYFQKLFFIFGAAKYYQDNFKYWSKFLYLQTKFSSILLFSKKKKKPFFKKLIFGYVNGGNSITSGLRFKNPSFLDSFSYLPFPDSLFIENSLQKFIEWISRISHLPPTIFLGHRNT